LDRKVDITNVEKPKTVQFSYSVDWIEDELEWKDRMSLYAESKFLPSSFEIHWLSIINSFVLVLLLTAFLTIILLRVLKNDFSRYMELEDDAMDEEEVCLCLHISLSSRLSVCHVRSRIFSAF
jgi:Endomembrane protein 70